MGKNSNKKEKKQMTTYGILKSTTCKGRYRIMRLSSGYDMGRARVKCDELNRVQGPKNNSILSVTYCVCMDYDK